VKEYPRIIRGIPAIKENLIRNEKKEYPRIIRRIPSDRGIFPEKMESA